MCSIYHCEEGRGLSRPSVFRGHIACLGGPGRGDPARRSNLHAYVNVSNKELSIAKAITTLRSYIVPEGE
jgi:hypothetical protein